MKNLYLSQAQRKLLNRPRSTDPFASLADRVIVRMGDQTLTIPNAAAYRSGPMEITVIASNNYGPDFAAVIVVEERDRVTEAYRLAEEMTHAGRRARASMQ